ncbi:hypothetical protein ACFSOZ_26005 [Mesorhizobium newzealandense]|uniref:Uncharacterized protein n=1 Tax=Mesorhizobium newzealandense TaxID=1300302 RepID=A0ABW4UHN6_9HYPH
MTHTMNAASAEGRIAANDNGRVCQVLAWPTLERLAHKHGKSRVDALRFWRDLTLPAGALVGTVGDDDTNPEFGLEIRPTEPALLDAIGWRVVGRERWHHTGKLVRTYERSDAEPKIVPEDKEAKPPTAKHIRLGALRFKGNELTEWRRTAQGMPLSPIERSARGMGASPSRSEGQIWAYLKDKPTTQSPMTAAPLMRQPIIPPSDPGAVDPLTAAWKATIAAKKTPAAARAADMLAEALKNTSMMPPVTRCPDGLVPGKQWVGGVPHCRNDAPGSVTGPWEAKSKAEQEMSRLAEETRLRAALADTATILDLAITDATARDIGIARGYTEASAEKYGASVIDLALDMLMKVADLPQSRVAANDNHKQAEKIAA